MRAKNIFLVVIALIAVSGLSLFGIWLYKQISREIEKTKFPGEPVLFLCLDKPSYNINEPVMARVILTNDGAGNLLIATGFDYSDRGLAPIRYHFIMKNSIGNEIGLNYEPDEIITINRTRFFNLGPHESAPCDTCKVNLGIIYPLQTPGTYFVQAVYRNEFDSTDGRKAWKGELNSNVVMFDIKP